MNAKGNSHPRHRAHSRVALSTDLEQVRPVRCRLAHCFIIADRTGETEATSPIDESRSTRSTWKIKAVVIHFGSHSFDDARSRASGSKAKATQ